MLQRIERCSNRNQQQHAAHRQEDPQPRRAAALGGGTGLGFLPGLLLGVRAGLQQRLALAAGGLRGGDALLRALVARLQETPLARGEPRPGARQPRLGVCERQPGPQEVGVLTAGLPLARPPPA